LTGFAVGWWLSTWLSGVFSYWGLGAATSLPLGIPWGRLLAWNDCRSSHPHQDRRHCRDLFIIFSFSSGPATAAAPFPAYEATPAGSFSGVAALACTVALLLYGVVHGKRMMFKRYELHTPLPVCGGELRIALISDVHMGRTIDESRFRRELDRLAEEKPDLLIIAGDLVTIKQPPR
jgi:hypothetical protein